MMVEYLANACPLSQSFGGVLAFLCSISFEERVQIVKRCCQQRRKSLFNELDIL